MALPPGPRLPGLVQALALMFQPQRFTAACARRYGDLFTINTGRFGRFVIAGGPDAVADVFRGPPDALAAGESNAPLGAILGQRSVLLLDGPEHRARRKLLLPPFHGARMQTYAGLVTEAADHAIDSWPVGKPFALLPEMQTLTLEVIVRAVFGVHDEREELARRVRAVLLPTGPGRFRMMLALLRRRPLEDARSEQEFAAHLRALDEWVFAEIRRRRADPELASRPDIMSLLLQATDEDGLPLPDRDIRDELVTLLFAGHETTATAGAWAFERLLRSPKALQALNESLARGERSYVEATVKEVLRVRPVLPNVGRVLHDEVEIGGYLLPEGTHVLPSIALVHRRAASWPAPRSFRPERFLGSEPAPYAWIPFGGGTRRCLGASFALLELRLVIERVLERCALEATSKRAEGVARNGITLTPDKGARVIQRRPPLPALERTESLTTVSS